MHRPRSTPSGAAPPRQAALPKPCFQACGAGGVGSCAPARAKRWRASADHQAPAPGPCRCGGSRWALHARRRRRYPCTRSPRRHDVGQGGAPRTAPCLVTPKARDPLAPARRACLPRPAGSPPKPMNRNVPCRSLERRPASIFTRTAPRARRAPPPSLASRRRSGSWRPHASSFWSGCRSMAGDGALRRVRPRARP